MMDLEMLCRAVQETKPWIDDFRKRTYEKAFRAYTDRFGPSYVEAVREAGEEGLQRLAGEVLDGIEAGWKRQRPWNRAAVRVMEKQMAVDYLSPMLLELLEPLCKTLCELLRDGWAARWPKDAYGTTTYQELKQGFRDTIMGIELGRRRRDKE